MAKPADWFIGIIVLIVIFSFIFVGISMFVTASEDDGSGFFAGSDAVAVVEIRGAIYDSYNTIKELKKWHRKKNVKALVIRLDSPGGGVAASHATYVQVKKIKQSGTPIVMSMGSVAASGAYYIACAGTEIIANPGVATGSIGVIAEFPVAEELLEKIGLNFETIISGKYKDSGNPAREMRKDEREYFQGIVNDLHEMFVEIVAEGRNMELDEVRKVADGRVFSGKQALNLGLVDRLGTYEDAIDRAKQLAGLDENAPVLRTPPRKWTLLNLLTSDLRGFLLELDYKPIAQYILR